MSNTAKKTAKTIKLSTPQARMIMTIAHATDKRLGPPWGFRDAGRAASAWHRTATSLVDKGLVERLHGGCGHVIVLTEAGVAHSGTINLMGS